jgi:hypothetical protein
MENPLYRLKEYFSGQNLAKFSIKKNTGLPTTKKLTHGKKICQHILFDMSWVHGASIYIYIYINLKQFLNKELGYQFSFPNYFTIKEHPNVLMAGCFILFII